MSRDRFGFLNKTIQKPLRYIGGELNSIVKKDAPASMLLAFPDVYEIGMSHYGSRILYEKINYGSPYSMERVYMPWKDAVDGMVKKGLPLVSIESGKGFKEFDAVGFSMQNELCYTNILAMLELGGLDVFREKRKDDDPVIIAGGGAVYNPTPMARFIDAFVIGEADDLVLDILKVLSHDMSKKDKLSELSRLRGVYVPSVHSREDIISKAVLKDLDRSPVIERPLVPYMELIHDRITYEVQRGCARGCRFCQAGMIYRPIRQRDPVSILEQIEKNVADTGYRDIGFLSLNACDYPPLMKLVDSIYKRFKGVGMFVSLPSLRIESISQEFLNVLSRLPKSGFTIAPEAGSKRIRKVINKDMSEEEIFNTIDLVSGLKWDSIKAYFMIGLPTETKEDVEAIADLAHRSVKHMAGRRTKLAVSVSNFVPKPHTPFQWEQQLCWEDFDKKMHLLLSLIKGGKLSMKWGDPKMGEVEGILCRGDERISDLIYAVYKKGETFSSWGSEFNYSRWEEAMKELGIDRFEYLSARTINNDLPWKNISSGISLDWLKQEREKAFEMSPTSDCTKQDCSRCGVCSSYGISNKIVHEAVPEKLDPNLPVSKVLSEKKFRLRVIMGKSAEFRWMGHFEFMDTVEKAILRADIPVVFSKGFKPVSEVSYAPPVGVGVESLVEPVDMYLYEKIDEKDFISKMNKQLPSALGIKNAFYIPLSAPSLYQDIKNVKWAAIFPAKEGFLQKLLNHDDWRNKVVEVERKGGIRQIGLSDFVLDLNANEKDGDLIVGMVLKMDNGKSVKPIEVLGSILEGLDPDQVRLTRRGLNINGIDFDN